MRWKVTLVEEVEAAQSIEHDIASVDRDERITPATLGLSIAEGEAVLAAIQAQLVGDQVQRHGEVARHYLWCGRLQSSKGHYRSTFRSVFRQHSRQGWSIDDILIQSLRNISLAESWRS